MKRLLWIAAFALVFPAVCIAQPAKTPAKAPVAKESAAPEPVARKSRRGGDARHCLDQTSNTAIIKCAEAYL